jgi:hypothetical protein
MVSKFRPRILVLGGTLAFFIFLLSSSFYVGAYSSAVTQQKCDDCFSGYSLTSQGAKITSASVSLKVPSVTCPSSSSGSLQANTFLVGLDGVQITDDYEAAALTVLCNPGDTTPYYGLSYTMGVSAFGSAPWSPSAGDVVSMTVKASSTSVSVALKDLTSKESFSVSSSYKGAALNAAECVLGTAGLPQVSYGVAHFTSCKATVGGKTGAINAFSSSGTLTEWTSYDSTGTYVLAQPSAISSSGSFTVTWKAAGP